MANVEVYGADGRVQIVDRPIDMILGKKSIIPLSELAPFYYTSDVKGANHDLPPYNHLIAYQPRLEPEYIDVPHRTTTGIGGKYVTYRNPMHLYFYTWDNIAVSNVENYGLEVFNDMEELSWASYQTSMHILDIVKYADYRTAPEYLRDFGHRNVAVIPISMPYYQVNNVVYWARWSFNSNGALRIYEDINYRLTGDEIDQGWNDTRGYKAEFIIVDVSNAQFFDNS